MTEERLHMIKIVLVDDHPVVRSGVKHVLQDQHDIQLIAEADNATEGYKLYSKVKPDVILLDMDLPDSSLAVLSQMVATHPKVNVIIFSGHKDVAFAVQAISAGAKGYVLKSSEPEQLIKAIRQVNSNKAYLSSEVAHEIALLNLNMGENPIRDLTPREFEVFRLLAEGEDIDAIAKRLNIGSKTVANYQTILKQKLNISTPIQLIRLALKHRVITLNFALLPLMIGIQE
jgi:DNA-binding NarL/FixJ family response regulator